MLGYYGVFRYGDCGGVTSIDSSGELSIGRYRDWSGGRCVRQID